MAVFLVYTVISPKFSGKCVGANRLDSQFLGHTRATDLLKNFKIGLIGLHSANLLQVSMDGPATNWKFYVNLLEDRKQEDPNIPSLLNVGSCGLHVVQGGFQTGNWRVF